jgi:hypothetical protein
MKKASKLTVMIIILAMLAGSFTGCASTKSAGIVGTVRPEANGATVYFLEMEIDGFNVAADEKGLPYARIPAGETTFRGRVIIRHSGVAFLSANVEFAFRLEQGKIYLIVGTAENMKWGVSIYENTYNPENKEINKIAFIPFIKQPTLQ